jgi:mycothiol synthase
MSTFDMRPSRDSDVPAIVDIWRISSAERGMPARTTESDLRIERSRPNFDPETMTRVAVVDARVVGVAAIEHQAEQAYANGYVVPEYRGRGIGAALMRWAHDRARALDGVTEFWASAAVEVPGGVELIESFGLEHVRSWFRMRHGAPASVDAPAWPDGIALRALEGDELLDALVAGYDGSFVDHFNFHPAQRDEWEHFVKNDPSFDPSLSFVAYHGDELAGMCMTQLHQTTDGMEAELGPIGTLRAYRGIGLGRALLRHGTRALAERGARAVTLGVDTQNPSGAVRLYASEGYERTHEGRSFRKELERG